MVKCCLDDACRGCGGEQCTSCRNDAVQKCCAGLQGVPSCANPLVPPGPGPAPQPVAPGSQCTCTSTAPDGAWHAGDVGHIGTCKGGRVACCSPQYNVDCGPAAPAPGPAPVP